MGSARLLTSSRRSDSLDGTLEEVTEFKRFNKVTNGGRQRLSPRAIGHYIRVPDHAPVLDANLGEGVIDFLDVLDTLVQRLLSPVQTSPLAQGCTE